MADEDLFQDDAGDDRDSAAEKLARYRSRPDAAMVQAETSRAGAQAGKGMKCPKCHCQNFRVLDTRPGEESKNRRRIRRSCGYVFRTCEFVTSNPTPDSILEEMIRKIDTDQMGGPTGPDPIPAPVAASSASIGSAGHASALLPERSPMTSLTPS